MLRWNLPADPAGFRLRCFVAGEHALKENVERGGATRKVSNSHPRDRGRGGRGAEAVYISHHHRPPMNDVTSSPQLNRHDIILPYSMYDATRHHRPLPNVRCHIIIIIPDCHDRYHPPPLYDTPVSPPLRP